MQLEMEPFDQRADGVSSWGNPSLYGSFSAVQHIYTCWQLYQPGRLCGQDAVALGNTQRAGKRCEERAGVIVLVRNITAKG